MLFLLGIISIWFLFSNELPKSCFEASSQSSCLCFINGYIPYFILSIILVSNLSEFNVIPCFWIFILYFIQGLQPQVGMLRGHRRTVELLISPEIVFWVRWPLSIQTGTLERYPRTIWVKWVVFGKLGYVAGRRISKECTVGHGELKIYPQISPSTLRFLSVHDKEWLGYVW